MSDHHDHHAGDYPNGDARLDITDFYAFRKPGDSAKTILVVNVHPEAPPSDHPFAHDAIYEVDVDTDGDAVAEVVFHIRFSPPREGTQTATVYRAEGARAGGADHGGEAVVRDAAVSFGREARVTRAGDYAFFAGIRSDPFFAEPTGFATMQFTGRDALAEANVFGIALEVPNHALGPTPSVGLWARVLVPATAEGAGAGAGDGWVQVERAALPGGNFLNQGEDKDAFNRSSPNQDRAIFQTKLAAAWQAAGGYTADEAAAIVQRLLPDILPYDSAHESAYPNGRTLTDDVIDQVIALLTKGRVTTDMVGPHTDLLAEFPYLGPAHGL